MSRRCMKTWVPNSEAQGGGKTQLSCSSRLKIKQRVPTSVETQGMAQRMTAVSSHSHSKETKHKVVPEIHNTKPNQPSTQSHDGGSRHYIRTTTEQLQQNIKTTDLIASVHPEPQTSSASSRPLLKLRNFYQSFVLVEWLLHVMWKVNIKGLLCRNVPHCLLSVCSSLRRESRKRLFSK